MNKYNKNKHQIKVKIANLVNKFCNCLTQSKGNFLTEMVQGTLASQSGLISEISRAISTENDKIKHVEKRLLRNLKSINNQDELQDTYQTLIDKKIDNDTIFCIDNSDITKSNRQNKFEHMSIIRDWSTREYKPGYHVTSIVALDRQNKNPI